LEEIDLQRCSMIPDRIFISFSSEESEKTMISALLKGKERLLVAD
jgi:hypothetical protein